MYILHMTILRSCISYAADPAVGVADPPDGGEAVTVADVLRDENVLPECITERLGVQPPLRPEFGATEQGVDDGPRVPDQVNHPDVQPLVLERREDTYPDNSSSSSSSSTLLKAFHIVGR